MGQAVLLCASLRTAGRNLQKEETRSASLGGQCDVKGLMEPKGKPPHLVPYLTSLPCRSRPTNLGAHGSRSPSEGLYVAIAKDEG